MLKKSIRIIVLVSAFPVSLSVWADKVNVNKASVAEIADVLNGVGPVKAKAIVTHCKTEKCLEPKDLLNVKGIGEKTMRKIENDVKFKDEK